MTVTEETPKQTMVMLVRGSLRRASKRCLQRGLARVLLPVIHLLQELFGLLLVHKGQPRQTLFQLKRMKKDTVLVVTPCVE